MGSHHGKGGGKGGQKKALEILPPVDINAGDYDKRTALHLAAGEGHTDVVQLLCERGANVNIEDRWGGRPLDGRYDVNCLRITQAACSAVLEPLFWHMILQYDIIFSHIRCLNTETPFLDTPRRYPAQLYGMCRDSRTIRCEIE